MGLVPDTRLVMVRHDLERVPTYALPAGCSVRWYHPGDERLWLEIQSATGLYDPLAPDLFALEFGDAPAALKERQCFLVDNQGAPLGTATAWMDPDCRGRPYGRVHWVAITPAMQGRGLSKPLMSLVCERLRDLGHERAYLTTSPASLPAINLYLQFGFVPEIDGGGELSAWTELLSGIRETSDRHRLQRLLESVQSR